MRTRLCTGILLLFAATQLSAAEVVLKNSWITKFKNRVSMPLTYKLEKAHKHPNPIGEKSQDGDMHLAGTSNEVGLPFVVEIVNAGLDAHKDVLSSIKTLVAKAGTVDIAGVWRLWFEHPAKKAQTQGDPVTAPKNTNPAHVFEVHPATLWDADPLDESFVQVAGFTAHDATTAFGRFEKMVVTVTKRTSFTSFEAKTIGFNYVDFRITLTGAPKKVADGLMVLATVQDLKGMPLVTSARRMVIAGDTPASALIGTAKKGAQFKVLGIPRLNLERLMEKAKPGQSIPVQAAYEMIIVGLKKI